MVKFIVKIGIMVFWIAFFSGVNGFAQQNDLQNIATSESSKMFKNHNGLISSSEMQAYQNNEFSQSGKGNEKNVSGKRKTTKKKKR
ncbi:MAG: hypothetical protein WC357_04955 [Candidatus Omnitrophota bacterium]|jgi:hypothetical protein